LNGKALKFDLTKTFSVGTIEEWGKNWLFSVPPPLGQNAATPIFDLTYTEDDVTTTATLAYNSISLGNGNLCVAPMNGVAVWQFPNPILILPMSAQLVMQVNFVTSNPSFNEFLNSILVINV
jgi:hypothetical protein